MSKLRELFKRQELFLPVLLVLVMVLSFGAVYSLTSKNNKSQIVEAQTAKDPSCSDTCVDLYQGKASPNTLAVAVGSYVQFNSKDGKTHDLSLGGGGSEHEHTGKFQSGEFKADEAWRVQFKEEGTFTFHDHYNPEVNIVVVVYTPGKDYKVE